MIWSAESRNCGKGTGSAQRDWCAELSWRESASKNCSVVSGTRGQACRAVTGCDSGANGIVSTASDDGRKSALLRIFTGRG